MCPRWDRRGNREPRGRHPGRDGFARGGGARPAPSPRPGYNPSLFTLRAGKRRQTPALPEMWTFPDRGRSKSPPSRARPIASPRVAQRSAGDRPWLERPHGPSSQGVRGCPQHKMCLWKLPVGVTSTTAEEGGGPDLSSPYLGRPRSSEWEAAYRTRGSHPRLCWEAACSAFLWPGPQPSGQNLAC